MTQEFSDTLKETLLISAKAEALRKQAARDIIACKIDHSNFFSRGRFDLYASTLPLPNGERTLAFNSCVTNKAIDDLLRASQNPYEIAFIGSKIIEQTYYNIFDFNVPDKPFKNLSVSKHYGIFFTPPFIAKRMVELSNEDDSKHVLLDPCSGGGALIFGHLLFGEKNKYSKIIGVDEDEQMVLWSKSLALRLIDILDYKTNIEFIHGDGIDFLLDADIKVEGTEIIINPPYGRFRFSKDRVTNRETELNENVSITNMQNDMSRRLSKIYTKASYLNKEKGLAEYSKFFFRICAEIAKKGSAVTIILPDSWMSNRDSINLRHFLLENYLIKEVLLLKEDECKFSTVNQATSIVRLEGCNHSFKVKHFFDTSNTDDEEISVNFIFNSFYNNLTIPKYSKAMIDIFKTLSSEVKFKNIPWIKNARGEIDQTFYKEYFVQEETSIPLIRGEHIEQFKFRHSSSAGKPSYMDDGFLAEFKSKPKFKDFCSVRLVGRQCSYAQQMRRVIFGIVPPSHAVGNSCNYLTVENDNSFNIYLLLGILNTAVIDLYFRTINSNNHVGNYEIGDFPFPSNESWHGQISSLSHIIEKKSGDNSCFVDMLEAVVAISFGLSVEQFKFITDQITMPNKERAVNFFMHFKRGIKLSFPSFGETFFNHTTPTLSELDRLIISHVPEGGNWQNIPESVPSERLKQIREMSAERGIVRTTYYGRLRRDQPAYTINTYYNRPGNGTHIHPIHDRTLTSREAARLQSFPDDYIFSGMEGAIRNQIGNAVPPLLAKAVGESLRRSLSENTCVDVFCGAGGLSLGLEQAGWNIVAAIDNNTDALNTYALNRNSSFMPSSYHPGFTSVLKKDLHNKSEFEESVNHIKQALKGSRLGLLVGGPPCQGFSHAGFRLKDDIRNDLAAIFLNYVSALNPELFVLENVEGLLTFNKGQVVKQIIGILEDLGYSVAQPIWQLSAEQYGVPQMRRRVFVVAAKEKEIPCLPKATHRKCQGRREKSEQGLLLNDGLLDPITVAQALEGLSYP